ncbi:MAG: hypothetical protein ACRDOH_15950, partial [Streptosporangiaceae bacterium]
MTATADHTYRWSNGTHNICILYLWLGPEPLASPPARQLARRCAVGSYEEQFRLSIDDPETFWLAAARDITW